MNKQSLAHIEISLKKGISGLHAMASDLAGIDQTVNAMDVLKAVRKLQRVLCSIESQKTGD